jgi:CNT family concentrative nucleoside transporter
MSGHQVMSVVGFVVLLAIGYALSRDRKAVQLKVILWGVGLQWVMAVILLKIPQGQRALEWLASGVSGVIGQAYKGSEFLFGEMGKVGGGNTSLGTIFAFQILPTIVFVAALFGVLYYLGVMQLIVRVLARAMVHVFGASGAESLCIAASIFMGQSEAPLTIRPFLAKLTESELFTVIVAGMASVSGAILSAYVALGGVKMEHLLTAMGMTAPISLVFAKLIVPETGKPETAGVVADAPVENSRNVLEAAANGTSDGLKLAVNVGAMLLSFIALVSLVNLLIGLIPIGGEPLTLERMLGWACAPMATLMGIPWDEAQQIGSVLGTRTVVNEIVAFQQLHQFHVQGLISDRSLSISTFAVCGFANLSSIGIQIGGLGALVPERKSDIARLGLLALVAATLANFSTACVAGALFSE